MIPLYGFLEGDVLGILVFAQEDDRVEDLIARLQSAAAVRVAAQPGMQMLLSGRVVEAQQRISALGLRPLDCFHVVGANR